MCITDYDQTQYFSLVQILNMAGLLNVFKIHLCTKHLTSVLHITKVVFYTEIVNLITILEYSISKKKQAHVYRRDRSGYISLKRMRAASPRVSTGMIPAKR